MPDAIDRAPTGQAPAAGRRRFKLAARLLALASALIGLLVVEWCLRARDVSFALPPSWRFHPVLGWTQPRNLRFTHRPEDHDVEVSFNSLGFHDVEHTLAKPPGVRRLLVLGDSFSEALQVNLEETWWKRLEARLAEGGAPWEAVNLGVGDFGTAQEWLALERYGLAYQPDMVVLQVFMLNDLCNNSLELYDLCKSPNDRFRPYYVEESGELRLTSGQPARNALRHLRTYALVEHLMGRLLPATHEGSEASYRRRWARVYDRPPYNPFSQSVLPPERQAGVTVRAWRITELLVQKIVDTCRARHVPLAVLVAPFEQSITNEWPNVDRYYPEKRLAGFLEPQGVPVAATIDAFERARAEVLPFTGGHPGSAGHRVMAEQVYRALASRGLTR